MKSPLLCVLMLSLFAFGCKSDNVSSEVKDVFSIYLVKDSNQFFSSEKPSLDAFVLEESPLLSISSITSYHWQPHLITFPANTKEQLKKREPLINYLFVVVANDERVYWGMFTDDASSYSCQNPVIKLLPRNPTTSCIPEGFTIERAYPAFIGDSTETDIRANVKIINALKESGKLAL